MLQDTLVLRNNIDWTNAMWIAFWALILILFFWFYTQYTSTVHRPHGEVYGAVVFGGGILERIGKISAFDYFVFIVIILASLYFIVTHILFGQFY